MCNQICNKFSVKKMSTCSMFSLGFVACNPCDKYFFRDDCKKNNGGSLVCPCCMRQVRTNPRSKKNLVVARLWINPICQNPKIRSI